MKKTYHCHGCKTRVELDGQEIKDGHEFPGGWDYVEVAEGVWAWMCDRCLPKVPHL